MIRKMHRARRRGMSLIEILAAVIIAATVAAIGIHYLRPVDQTSRQRSCDLTRQLLQNDAQRYLETTGGVTSADLRELKSAEYSGTVLPTCPSTGESYRLDRNGTVVCPTHGK